MILWTNLPVFSRCLTGTERFLRKRLYSFCFLFLLRYRFHTLKIANSKIANSVKVFQLYPDLSIFFPDFSISPSAFTQLHFLIIIFSSAFYHSHFITHPQRSIVGRCLLRAFGHAVATCWANNTQHVATHRHRAAKRTQYVHVLIV